MLHLLIKLLSKKLARSKGLGWQDDYLPRLQTCIYAPVNPKREAIAIVTTTTVGASASRTSDMIMSRFLVFGTTKVPGSKVGTQREDYTPSRQ